MILEICLELFDFCCGAGLDDHGQYTVFCSKKHFSNGAFPALARGEFIFPLDSKNPWPGEGNPRDNLDPPG